MSVTSAGAPGAMVGPRGLSRLWNRQLDTYPDTAPRLGYLGITVLGTIFLYYAFYVGGSVSTLLLANLHMSFSFFVLILAFGNLVGAFGSLFAGLADRVGRTNMVVVGLIIVALLVGIIMPLATNRWEYGIAYFVLGAIEGICLVATPALIRDFSPQVGRAKAMGFWTSGPVLGSLVVAVVATHTINAHTDWQHEYRLAGLAGLVVAAIALIWLRELSPALRDQLMVSMRDRTLVEARAKGIDVEAAMRNPWGQLLKLDVIVSSIGVSVLLIFYYTAVAFGTIYFVTIFNTTLKNANGLANWAWGFNVVAVILVGFVSDWLRVRKPFMIAGGVCAAIALVFYLERAGKPTGYYHLALLVAAVSFFIGIAYTPWMAGYTETVEDRNPALTATGLAIWGWIIRVVVFISFLIIPHVITSVNPLVDYGSTVQAASAKYGSEVAFATSHPQVVATATKLAPELAAVSAHPALFTQLAAHPTPALIAAAQAAVGPAMFSQIAANQAAIASVVPYASQLSQLQAASKDPNFQVLVKHGAAVAKAAKDAPGQWKTWYWICFAAMIFFLLTVPLMRGRWSPKAAKAEEDAHNAMVEAELAKLHA